MINLSLYAHNEALFILLFNATLLFILQYLIKKKKKWLLLVSVLTGLTLSTKLNGIMLLPIFILVHAYNIFKRSSKNRLFSILLSKVSKYALIAFCVFVILNPFIWKSPLSNTTYIFRHRIETQKLQQTIFPDSALRNLKTRIVKLYANYFDGGGYNNIRFNISLFNNGRLWLLLFILGLTSVVFEKKRLKQKNNILVVMVFLATLVITIFYLGLDWPRYYLHLTAFFIYFEVLGLVFILKTLGFLLSCRRTPRMVAG